MPQTSNPRTELTRRLEVAKRQFFQWYVLEKRSIPWIKKEMDDLTMVLRKLTGNDFVADEKKWRGRQRRWNKSEWKIKRRDRGLHNSVTPELLQLPLWRRGNEDVGDWRVAALMLNQGNPKNSDEKSGQLEDQLKVEGNDCPHLSDMSSNQTWSNSDNYTQPRNLSMSSLSSQASSWKLPSNYLSVDGATAVTEDTLRQSSSTFISQNVDPPQLPHGPIHNCTPIAGADMSHKNGSIGYDSSLESIEYPRRPASYTYNPWLDHWTSNV